MTPSRQDIMSDFTLWLKAWDNHDLEGVLDFMHEEVVFENWTGAIVHGKEALRRAWTPWFQRHGNFKFFTEDVFFDDPAQKMTFQWRLDWPSQEKHYIGLAESRRGVDLLHFKDGKIFRKLTYSKTTLEIDSKMVHLTAHIH